MTSYSNKKKRVKRLDSENEGVGGGRVNGGSKFGFRRQENRVTIQLASRTRHEMKEIKRRLVSELEVVRRLVKKIEDVGSGEKRMPKVNKFYKDRMVSGESNKKGGKKQVGVNAKVASKLFKSCGVLLERLMKHKHGWVFNAPVDPLALGLHDYFDVIKNPMDLGTVKSRLDKNWYNSPMEFAEDVRLTFRNATTYNPQGHDVYIMAEVLLKLFEEKWKVIEAEFIRESRVVVDNEVRLPTPLPKRAPPQVLPVPEMRSEPHVPAVQPIEQPPKVPKLGRPPSLKKPKARDINKREMTYDEKQKLSIDLQNLPSEKLDHVVHIIKKRLPSLSQKDDEIEVDIDTFDTETLWELDRFVANYWKGLTKNKRKAEFSNDDRIEAESEFPNDERIEVQSELPNHERIEVESVFPNQERTEVESEFPNQERTEVESEFLNYERMEVESEFPNQERIEVEANVPDKNRAQVMVDVPKEAETDGRMTSATSPVQMQRQVEEQVAHGDKSSSSSSSSSNSGSSSGSDSDSSSGAGSDAGHSSKA
nr:transcription factor GTE4 isoform X1 [Tanacetum cinerariifolium]